MVIAATGCSSGSSNAPTTGPSSPPATTTQQQGPQLPAQDKLDQLATKEQLSTMAPLAKQWDLEAIYAPTSEAIDQGYIGIAPLGTSCLVAFFTDDSTLETLGMVRISRFASDGVTIIKSHTPIASIKAELDKLKASCKSQ